MKITNVLFGLNKKSDFIFEQNGKAFPDKQPYSSRKPKREEKPLGSSPVKRSGDFLSCSPTSCIGLWGARCGWGEVQVLPLPCSSWDTGTAREGTWHSSALRGRDGKLCFIRDLWSAVLESTEAARMPCFKNSCWWAQLRLVSCGSVLGKGQTSCFKMELALIFADSLQFPVLLVQV